MEQAPNEATASLDDDEFHAVPPERATRFYDRVRKSIQSYLDSKGNAVEKAGDYLLLVPDVFMLLWRLANDPRVNGKDKVLLGTGVAYFIFPFDLIPEAIVGPIGYLDDLVFGVFVINKIVSSAGENVVREHWSGSEDVLAMIHRVLGAANHLVGSDVLDKVKKIVRRGRE